MEIRIAAFAAGIVFGALVAGPASATLITGSYTGIIYDSYDETNVFGAGTGDDTVTGRAVSGTFSYVVEDVAPDLCPGVGACYQDYNGVNWLDISVTINGVTLTIQTTPTAGQNFQALYNHDFATGGEDFFSVYERDEQQAHDLAANDEIYRNDALLVRFHDYLSEFALGDGVPVSSFTWIDDDVSDFGDGAVQWFNYILDLDSNTYLSNNHAYANWNLLSLSLQGQAVQVPEPGTIALFAVGLLGIAWLSRRDRRTHAGARLTQAS